MFIYFRVLKSEPTEDYMTTVTITVLAALAVFTLIVAYHIWNFILCHYRPFVKIDKRLLAIIKKYSPFGAKKTTSKEERSMDRYEEYQDDLLALYLYKEHIKLRKYTIIH